MQILPASETSEVPFPRCALTVNTRCDCEKVNAGNSPFCLTLPTLVENWAALYSVSMCGIAGYSLSKNENVDAAALASALLVGIEPRGRHATGAAWQSPGTGQVWLTKEPIPASEFVRKYEHVEENTHTAVLHTRWATKGSTQQPVNNHPIETGGIVGVHNGVIGNDDALFNLIGPERRIGEVDSEAVFAMLAYGGTSAGEAFEKLEGSAAVAWLDVDQPDTLHLARISSSPLVLARTAKGSLLFASTEGAIRAAVKQTSIVLTRVFTLDEGISFTARFGQLTKMERFSTEERILTDIERKALQVA